MPNGHYNRQHRDRGSGRGEGNRCRFDLAWDALIGRKDFNAGMRELEQCSRGSIPANNKVYFVMSLVRSLRDVGEGKFEKERLRRAIQIRYMGEKDAGKREFYRFVAEKLSRVTKENLEELLTFLEAVAIFAKKQRG